jgi:hypothetical protein
MLAFEGFLEPSFACNIGKVILCVTDPCLALGDGTPVFDASGDWVKGYMKVVRAASILRSINSINLHLSHAQPYLFEGAINGYKECLWAAEDDHRSIIANVKDKITQCLTLLEILVGIQMNANTIRVFALCDELIVLICIQRKQRSKV